MLASESEAMFIFGIGLFKSHGKVRLGLEMMAKLSGFSENRQAIRWYGVDTGGGGYHAASSDMDFTGTRVGRQDVGMKRLVDMFGTGVLVSLRCTMSRSRS